MLHAMIMAGGGGTRFWPRSRNARPKQFLNFSGERSLLQGTLDRIAPVVPVERCWVVTGAAYIEETASQLPELSRDRIVGEPLRRDTAPCVALGAALIANTDPDATIIVMPADHLIEPEREFQRAVHAAEQFAEEFPKSLFTFGIPPTFPSTGYGYIHRGAKASERSGISLYRVKEFKGINDGVKTPPIFFDELIQIAGPPLQYRIPFRSIQQLLGPCLFKDIANIDGGNHRYAALGRG